MKKFFKILCPAVLTGAFIMPYTANAAGYSEPEHGYFNPGYYSYPEHDYFNENNYSYPEYDRFNENGCPGSGIPFYQEDVYSLKRYEDYIEELINGISADEEITEDIIIDEPVITAEICNCETDGIIPDETEEPETPTVKTVKPFLDPPVQSVMSIGSEAETANAEQTVPDEIPNPEPNTEIIAEENPGIPIAEIPVNEPESSFVIERPEPEIPDSELVKTDSEPPLINPQGGNGEMIESASNGDVNREFITVKTQNGAVFYIVIDRDSKTENVYFLNAVDEYDLMAFAENFPEEILAELETGSENPDGGDAEDSEDSDKNEDDKSGKETGGEPKSGKKSNALLIGVLAAAGIGGLVYFKVIKPKQVGKKNKNQVYEDEEDYEDEPVNEDDM
jgi:hypothetical protein